MIKTVQFLRVILPLLFVIVFSSHANAERSRYYGEQGVAIRGYDTVAYFTEAKAKRGKSQYNHQWMGSTWHFSSAANRDAFAANPQKYAPQYNGYCAWAASNNYIYQTNPKAWTVHNGKLYLNAGLSVRIRWALDKDGNIQKGDKNWPDLQTQLL